MVWTRGKNGRVPYGHKGVAEVGGGKVRGIPRLSWMDGVNVDFCSRGMTVEVMRQFAKDRKEWRALENIYIVELHAPIFA